MNETFVYDLERTIPFSSATILSLTWGQKWCLKSSPSQTVVAKGLLPSTSSLNGLKTPSPFLSSVYHSAAIFFPCTLATCCNRPIIAKHDFSGNCKEIVRSCLAKAARRRGGTERRFCGGKRTEDRERRSRTVVVCTLILCFAC